MTQSKYVFVAMDTFSRFPFLIPLKDTRTETLENALLHVLSYTGGSVKEVHTDNGASISGKLWKSVLSLLGIHVLFSAPIAPRSNAQAEGLVKSLAEKIRIFCGKDSQIDRWLDIISWSLRSAVIPGLGVSPFQLVFGREPSHFYDLGKSQSTDLLPDQQTYLDELKKRLAFLHEAVSKNEVEHRAEIKRAYDTRHRVEEPPFVIGDIVFLLTKKPKPFSDNIISHRQYGKRFVIIEVVKNPHFSTVYRLADMDTGKPLSRLINPDRLKKCHATERTDFLKRNPPLSQDWDESDPASIPLGEQHRKPMPTAGDGKILSTFKVDNELIYKVQFPSGEIKNCIQVSDDLLRNFALTKDSKRRKRK